MKYKESFGQVKVFEGQRMRELLNEAWGALGWLEGTIELSDRARAYKAKKLREALVAAESFYNQFDSMPPLYGLFHKGQWAVDGLGRAMFATNQKALFAQRDDWASTDWEVREVPPKMLYWLFRGVNLIG